MIPEEFASHFPSSYVILSHKKKGEDILKEEESAMRDSDWEIVYELYKNPNLTRVAKLLYMAQPSLTKRLKHIEEELAVTIVDRTPKGLELTPEGRYLGERAKEYLDFRKDVQEHLEQMRENAEYLITIGSSYTYSKYILSDLLIQYQKQHPQIRFHVINEPSNLLFRRMLEGSVDVGFIRGDYEGAVHQVLLGSNPAYLVTKEPVDLSRLPELPYIGYRTNDRTREILGDWWRERYETELPEGMVAGYVDVAWQLIHKGLGYTLCFLPDNFENEYGLCLTPLTRLDSSAVCRNTWFLYPKDKRISSALDDFITYIIQQYQSGSLPGRS